MMDDLKLNIKYIANKAIMVLNNTIDIFRNSNQKVRRAIDLANIQRLIWFGFLILIVQLITFFFDNSYIFGVNIILSLILILVNVLYIFLAVGLLNKKDINYIYVRLLYLSFIVITYGIIFPLVLLQILDPSHFYKLIVFLILVIFAPFLDLKQICYISLFSIIIPIIFTIKFMMPIDYLIQLSFFYICSIVISQNLFINYKKYLCEEFRLEDLNKKLMIKTETDPLTGLLNRYGIQRRIDILLSPEIEREINFAVLMIDIDYFKKYNDTFGHQSGDICLKKVSAAIKSCVKNSTDFVARYGGEEFLVFLYDITENQAIRIAKKICFEIESLKILSPETKASKFVTVSIGASVAASKESLAYTRTLNEADKQLYNIKRNNKNAVGFKNGIYRKKAIY